MMPISNLNRKSVASRFSAAADTYSRHAGVQQKAAAELMKLMARSSDLRTAPESILEIGCGTGLFTEKLAKKFPGARICATDISPRMVCKSQERLGFHGNIEWLAGDFLGLKGLGRFDLATSSSSLHWITPLEKTFRKICRLLRKNGNLAFSIMAKGTLGELHAARNRAAPSKKAPQQLPDRREIMHALKASGFKITSQSASISRSIFPSASRLLQSLHKQGVTSGQFASERAPLNRTELHRLVSWYNTHYKCRGGVFATYKVLYVMARKTHNT